MSSLLIPERVSVLLLGNYRATIAVARALSQAGYRVISGLEGEPLGAHCSRFVDEFWNHPDLRKGGDAFLAALIDFVSRRRDLGVVLPVSEEFALFLAEHEDAITARLVLASPARTVVETFADKPSALNLASALGVPTAPFACVSDYASLLSESVRLGFPLTVRALGATARLLGRKALICADRKALTATLPDWPQGHARLLLQSFASGRRHNLYFAAQAGRLIAVAESQIHRTNALDGTGLAVDGTTVHPDTQLVADTQRLISATGYTGIGLAQFIVDNQSGKRCFLELNPRVSGSHIVAESAGLPLSRLAVELATGARPQLIGRIAECRFVGRAGLRYAWTGGDLIALKQGLAGGEISLSQALMWLLRAVRTALSAHIHMVASWRDPGPALMLLLLLMPRGRRLASAFAKLWTARRIRHAPWQDAKAVGRVNQGPLESATF